MVAVRRQLIRGRALALALLLLCGGLPAVAAAEDSQAVEALDRSEPAASERALAKAAKSLPANSLSDLEQATTLMVKGDYAQAAERFQLVLEQRPDNVDALAGLGMALGRQYKLDQADQQFEKVLAIQPNNPVAHCGKAMVLLYRVEKGELGSLSRAQALHAAGRECNKALDADTRVVEAHYLLGTVFKEEGRLDLAAQAFSGAVRLDPRYVRAYNMLAGVQVQKGNLQEAIENYKQAISIQPNGVTAHIGLAELYSRQGRELDAISELNAVIGFSPKNLAARLALAKLLEGRGETAAALKEYQELKQLRPDDIQSYLEIARLSEKQGDYSQALNELQSALVAVPKNAALRLRIAHDRLMLGQIDEALKAFEALYSADPSDHGALFGLTVASYAKSLHYAPPAFVATSEFQLYSQQVWQLSKRLPNDQLFQLADAVMRGMAGQKSEVSPPLATASIDSKLLYSELLMARRQFTEASAALFTAMNGTTNADEVAMSADTALVLRDLESAEAGYKRVMIFTGQQQRAQLGLAAVDALREQANKDLNDADTLLQAKQFDKAVDKYRACVAANARLAAARVGLAEALEKQAVVAEVPLNALRDALFQYQSYLALSPGIFPREQERVQKRISRIESAIAHLKQNPRTGVRQLLDRLL